jgi:hypothetical protein
VAFVDLFKAYDTANHSLILDILKRYGAPPQFVSAIEHAYQNLTVVLKIEQEAVELPQTVGVQQGNNMAPVLFLFLMSAFAETLETEWKNAGIGVCTVCLVDGQKLASGEGKLRGHLPKEYLSRELATVKILQCLYVDDGAFIFASRPNMTRGLTLVHCHFSHFGLQMHIGRGDIPSKTEYVFFPPPGFFDSYMPAQLDQDTGTEMDNALGYNDNALTNDERCDEQKAQLCRNREEELYNAFEEIQPIVVADGSVTFCQHFKYLG